MIIMFWKSKVEKKELDKLFTVLAGYIGLVYTSDDGKRNTPNDRIQNTTLADKIDAILDYLGMEYYEKITPEKKESGLRKTKIVLCANDLFKKPKKKRGRPLGSKNKKK